jgi:RimJ/RimL family protein N-acetyltransferase
VYLFSSKRLGFRTWNESDLDALVLLNQNTEVMKYFPSVQTAAQCLDFINRMQKQMTENGHCYFVVEELESGKFIGFIGLLLQTFESDFTPAVDIGWRLSPEFWGKGFAIEGALRCLEFGWSELGLKKIISVAPQINVPSLRVMEKIGMVKVKTFNHPLLNDYPELQSCELYQLMK